MFLGQGHMNDMTRADYERYRHEDVYGWFMLGKPVLGVNNLDMIKEICVKDFNNFVDRNPEDFMQAFESGGDLDKVSNLMKEY